MNNINETISPFSELVNEYTKCWIGGWGQGDFNHYRNPDNEGQVISIETDFIYTLIEKKFRIKIDPLAEKIGDNLAFYKKYQQHILTELSIIKDSDGFKSENEILQSIEKFSWGLSIRLYKYGKAKPDNGI